jgi:hypothetical protein
VIKGSVKGKGKGKVGKGKRGRLEGERGGDWKGGK